jgi:hypothetical protein
MVKRNMKKIVWEKSALTLTLSPGEREQQSALAGCSFNCPVSSAIDFLTKRRTILPLPPGEGRGEGEGV